MRATVLAAQAIPPSVVTMRSRVEFRDDVTDAVCRVTLVYPGEDDPEAGLYLV
jgi:regulator of nucleoside diphosphate kinase